MKQFFYSILLFLSASTAYSQPKKFRAPAWTFHDKNTIIAGLSAGLASGTSPRNVTSIGVHVEVPGFGLLGMMLPSHPLKDAAYYPEYFKDPPTEVVYGLHLSLLGTLSRADMHGIGINGITSILRKINGIHVASVFNFAGTANGLQLSIMFNSVYKINGLQIGAGKNEALIRSVGIQLGGYNVSPDHTGLQIGIFNKTKKLTGLQIGIWNENAKRKLPLLNW